MSKKVNKRKFFRPGSLEVPGTKISIKTMPYLNGVIFDTQDPITSFHTYMALLKTLIRNYQYMADIPGMSDMITPEDKLNPTDVNKLYMVVELLALSPIEMIVKEQVVDQTILTELAVQQNDRTN